MRVPGIVLRTVSLCALVVIPTSGCGTEESSAAPNVANRPSTGAGSDSHDRLWTPKTHEQHPPNGDGPLWSARVFHVPSKFDWNQFGFTSRELKREGIEMRAFVGGLATFSVDEVTKFDPDDVVAALRKVHLNKITLTEAAPGQYLLSCGFG